MNGVAAALLGLFTVVTISLGIHTIPEGHVGVYWRGGALLNRLTHPGFNLKIPYLDQVEQVQVTVQTDSVRNIPCGTSGGVMVSFAKIEVVNRLHKEYALETIRNYTVHYDRPLIFDKVHHLINQHCSAHSLREVYIDLFDTLDEMLQADLQAEADKWAPGVEIIAVRVTKPIIPASIRDNFERMEAEKTKLLIATEVQRVREKEAETEKLVATIGAQRDANVSRVNMQREIEEKEAARRLAGIADTMHVARERALADAEHYKALKDADANAKRLTPAYLEFQRIQSMSNVKKAYFGKSLPDMFATKQDASMVQQVQQPPSGGGESASAGHGTAEGVMSVDARGTAQ